MHVKLRSSLKPVIFSADHRHTSINFVGIDNRIPIESFGIFHRFVWNPRLFPSNNPEFEPISKYWLYCSISSFIRRFAIIVSSFQYYGIQALAILSLNFWSTRSSRLRTLALDVKSLCSWDSFHWWWIARI